eukprot:2925635-Rhodomonas_salina.4
MWACINGHEATASMLVDKRADINAKDNNVSPVRVRMAGSRQFKGQGQQKQGGMLVFVAARV